jgi:hypothetical protein
MENYSSESNSAYEGNNKPGPYEIFTRVIRTGDKTFFFDIRKSKTDGHYLVITESIKKEDDDGRPFYKRSKIFVSQEDMKVFRDVLDIAIRHIDSIEPEMTILEKPEAENES